MTSRSFTVATADGALLRVQEHGAGDPSSDLPTVVLAHGWTLTRDSWLPVVGPLVAAGVRVVTYDQRGHGESSPLHGAASVRMLGDDLAAVLDIVAPHGPVVLFGVDADPAHVQLTRDMVAGNLAPDDGPVLRCPRRARRERGARGAARHTHPRAGG